MAHPPSAPRAHSQAPYLPNGAPPVAGPVPGARPLDPNQGRVQQIGHARVLCIADVRGNLRQLNDLARLAKADYIIHTGDFGFYDEHSLERIAEKTLKHVAQYSPLLPDHVKAEIARNHNQHSVKERFQRERLPLSELPQFLNKTFKLDVPVFTVWGACEDVAVLERLRSGEYKIDNLHVIDESHSRLLDVGGVKLRLLGLGGAVVMHKMFDNGEGRTTIAGGQGTMWTTLLQLGELIDTANRVYDPTETRVLITHASPAREGVLNQLSVTLKADFSISAGLHFRYGSSYNEFSVNPSLDHYRGKLSASKAQFNDVWETVKQEVEPAVAENDAQNKLLQQALDLVSKMPATASGGNPFGGGPPPNGQVDESAFKNMWNFNLADAAFGWLVLDIDQGRIGTEMRAQGFNFSHRGAKTQQQRAQPPLPAQTGGNLPTPAQQLPPQQVPRAAQAAPAAQTAAIASPPPQSRVHQSVAPQTNKQTPAGQPAPSPNTSALTANGVTASPSTLPPATHTNGTAGANSATPKPTDTPKQGGIQQSPGPQEPSKGIFISNTYNLNTAEEVKSQLFSAEDAEKITNVEKSAKGPWIAYFATPEIMQEVLKRSPSKEALEKHKSVRMAVYRTGGRGGYGTSTWGSSRGSGAPRGAADAARGGYQSAGGAGTGSDSETNRGRGRGGRGGFRGERGGRGRGRGATPAKTEGTAPATPSATTPSGGDS
ncbi:hypothetical protein BDY17DRAFT_308839 [Neohortaea acidophila]|uniref:Uncharacterized protein n=1 Tax=Neohortaea acidophila TaxID=245834 RepID=A0A6A6Q0D8_9PEZI|nr:uncharacterized protein BDY17DRAFT_308839 [Neohortaea acidophila]KAF2485464.1 hypothetical protein BDY17DRAFT_308839 [Neohortaea acidophila]